MWLNGKRSFSGSTTPPKTVTKLRMRTEVRERLVELLARAGDLVVLERERAEREDRKRALLEGDAMPAQEVRASACQRPMYKAPPRTTQS